jgi:hypothetical protein
VRILSTTGQLPNVLTSRPRGRFLRASDKKKRQFSQGIGRENIKFCDVGPKADCFFVMGLIIL